MDNIQWQFQVGYLSRSSHFLTRHDAERATLTKNNTAQSFRNDLNGLNTQQKVNYRVFNTEAGSQKDWSPSWPSMWGSAHGTRPPMSLCAWNSQKSPILQVCQIFAGISVLLLAMRREQGIPLPLPLNPHMHPWTYVPLSWPARRRSWVNAVVQPPLHGYRWSPQRRHCVAFVRTYVPGRSGDMQWWADSNSNRYSTCVIQIDLYLAIQTASRRHRSRIRYLSKKISRILTNFPKLKKFVKIRTKIR